MHSKTESICEVIYNKLLDAIVSGRLSPGEKLTEQKLAAEFEVSRTPIREALMQLGRNGFITITKGRGAYVKKLSIHEIVEIYDVISLLEGHAVEQVVPKLKNQDVKFLKHLESRMEHASAERNYLLYIETNKQFHGFFVEKCGNKTIEHIISEQRSKINRYVYGISLPMYIDKYLFAHTQILEAIIAGEADLAGKAMKKHNMEAANYLVEVDKLSRV